MTLDEKMIKINKFINTVMNSNDYDIDVDIKKVKKVSRYNIAISLVCNWSISIDSFCLKFKIPMKQKDEVKEIRELLKLEFGTILDNHNKFSYGQNESLPYSNSEQNFLFLFRNSLSTWYLNKLLKRNRKSSYKTVLDRYYFDSSCFTGRMAKIIGATVEDFEGNPKDFNSYKFLYD